MDGDDRIGTIGQNEFSSLCERERLYASRPEPDRTGKDFIVEWKPHNEQGFDTRSTPRKCIVQIKSTRIGSRQVRVKLSAAEWLAKDLSPSFILCPVVDEADAETVDHYVGYHIAGIWLERILKPLRKAAFDGRNPSHLYVTFPLSKGQKLLPHMVRAWFEDMCGADMAHYSAEKSLALKTLGYDDDGPEYVMTFSAGSVTEIVECLMGQRELDASFGPPFRTRFGVKARAPDELALPPAGRVSVTPHGSEVWQVEVLDHAGAAKASLELQGQTVAFEGLPQEHWRSEATNGLVLISILHRTVTVKFLAGQMLDRPHDLDELIRSVEFWLSLVACAGRFRILKQNGFSPELRINIVRSDLESVLERGLVLLKAARALYSYCQVVGVTISFEALTQRAREIIQAARQLDLRQVHEPWVICECRPENVEELAARIATGATLLMTFPVIMGDDVIALSVAYAVRPEWEGADLKLHATSRFPLRGRRLDRNDPVTDYREFMDGLREEVSPVLHAHTPLSEAAGE